MIVGALHHESITLRNKHNGGDSEATCKNGKDSVTTADHFSQRLQSKLYGMGDLIQTAGKYADSG